MMTYFKSSNDYGRKGRLLDHNNNVMSIFGKWRCWVRRPNLQSLGCVLRAEKLYANISCCFVSIEIYGSSNSLSHKVWSQHTHTRKGTGTTRGEWSYYGAQRSAVQLCGCCLTDPPRPGPRNKWRAKRFQMSTTSTQFS
jgi:hypothetical protein